MANRNFIITQLFIFGALFLRYLSSSNPGYLVFLLCIIGALISTSELINFNRMLYYVALLGILLFQSMIMINTYLFNTAYLQNTEQYLVFAFGVFAYIVIIALLLKPDIFKRVEMEQTNPETNE